LAGAAAGRNVARPSATLLAGADLAAGKRAIIDAALKELNATGSARRAIWHTWFVELCLRQVTDLRANQRETKVTLD
jgi:hypothetical protein